jgi:wyosine [tRNA(Phe)-imidazoG37] synthetase (radical SAM superfamily)
VASHLNEKELRLGWVTKRYGDGIALIEQGKIPPAPLQIEIHPYHCAQAMPCNNRCIWCTRLEDKIALKSGQVEGIDPDRLIAFIASLAGSGVRRIVVSGNSTEPLLYPRIEEVIQVIHGADMNWVLYTNFYYGRKIIDAAVEFARPGDVLRVSLDAGNEAAYLKTHRPQDGPGAFRTVVANLTALLQERTRRGAPLSVGIAYLMTNDNSSEQELTSAIVWAEQVGVDFLRFSVPLKPTHQNPEFALAEDEAARIKRRISRLAWQHELRRGLCASRMRIEIRQDEVEQGPKPFRVCHHCKLIPVLGVRGKLYPCTSTSTEDFDHLGLGNINDPNFENTFWGIWRDPGKWRHNTGGCPDCTRFEYDLNTEIERRIARAGYQSECELGPSHHDLVASPSAKADSKRAACGESLVDSIEHTKSVPNAPLRL